MIASLLVNPEYAFKIVILCVVVCMLMIRLANVIRSASLLPYSIIGYRLGIPVVEETNPSLIKEIMDSTVKGEFLEKRIACPAWYPILSLESTDNDTWSELRANYDVFTKALPPVSRLTEIMKDEVDSTLEKAKKGNGFMVTSPVIVRLTIQVLWRWMFDDDMNCDVDLLEQASLEWRKELAVKGKGDMRIKLSAIAHVLDRIKKSERYSKLFEDWNDPIHFSVVMQPFIISPMINFSDIAVSMVDESNPIKAILKSHPFPILERNLEHDVGPYKKGTQVIIFNSEVAKQLDAELWMAFGIGPRRCQGAHYALPMLKELSRLRGPWFAPEVGHLYSGRNNDNSVNLSQLLYFTKRVISAILIE